MSTRFNSICIKPIRPALLLFAFLFFAGRAFAWGERGHFIIGYTAVRLFQTQPTPQERQKLGTFFTSRLFMMAHLSNIPDISWRDPRRPNVVAMNAPTHYFDVEYMVGLPPNNPKALPAYYDKIRNLEPNLHSFVKKYRGHLSAFGTAKKIDITHDVGSAPFRTQQLFDDMVSAFRCAKSKESRHTHDSRKHFEEPIRDGRYICSDKTTHLEDLAAAVELGGVMGHFVGDLSQPLHVTADHDGYATGHGGLHAYFETFLLHFLDERLTGDVLKMARSAAFQKRINRRLRLEKFSDLPVTTIMYHLAADSFSKREAFYKADSKFAILKPGSVSPLGDKLPVNGVPAIRRDYRNPKVQRAFRPLIVERLAVSSLLLYKLWHRAWVEGGKPDVHAVSYISTPYALDVPFILPPKELLPPVKP